MTQANAFPNRSGLQDSRPPVVDLRLRRMLEERLGRELTDEEFLQITNPGSVRPGLSPVELDAPEPDLTPLTSAEPEPVGKVPLKQRAIHELTRDQGDLGFRLLQTLGNVGGAVAGGRAIQDANRQDQSSQARANLINALSSRAVARGTRTQPSLGLLGQLSSGLAGIGEAGQQHGKLRRARDKQRFEEKDATRLRDIAEYNAVSSRISALANQGRGQRGDGPKKYTLAELLELRRTNPGGVGLDERDYLPTQWAIIKGDPEVEEPEGLDRWELENLRRLYPGGVNLDEKDYDEDDWRIITGAAPDPEEDDPTDTDVLALADAIRGDMAPGERLSREEVEARIEGDPALSAQMGAMGDRASTVINRAMTPTAVAGRAMPGSGSRSGGLTATGRMNLQEAELFEVQVAQVANMFSQAQLKGGMLDRVLAAIGATGMPTITDEAGEEMSMDIEDRIFQEFYPEDSAFRQQLGAFSILYASAINNGRPSEADRKAAARALPVIGESEEVQRQKLKLLSEVALARTLLLRANLDLKLQGFLDLTPVNPLMQRTVLIDAISERMGPASAAELANKLRANDRHFASPEDAESVDYKEIKVHDYTSAASDSTSPPKEE